MKESYLDQYIDYNFGQCEFSTFSSIFVILANIIYIELILICSIILIFLEWNLESSNFNPKRIITALCFDLIFINGFIFVYLIEITGVYLYFITRFVYIYLWIIFRHMIIFEINIFSVCLTPRNEAKVANSNIKKEEDEKESVISISTFRSSCVNNVTSTKSNPNEEESLILNAYHYKSTFLGKIMGYHYSKKKES
jgi:hypothetical protein